MTSLVNATRARLKRLHRAVQQVMASGDAEAIHSVRVSSRRLNELLELMTVSLPRRRVRRAAAELRELRQVLRRVRDLDVLLISLCSPRTNHGIETADLARLEGVLTRERELAFAKARRRCARLRTGRLVRRIERLCERAVAKGGDDRSLLEARLSEMLRRRAARLLSRDPRQGDSTDLHDVRIRLKRLRYCAELVRRFEFELSDGAVQTFAGTQEALGRWHDHLMAAEQITRVARRHTALHAQTGWAARLLDYAAFRARSANEDRERILRNWPLVRGYLQEALGPATAAASPRKARAAVVRPNCQDDHEQLETSAE